MQRKPAKQRRKAEADNDQSTQYGVNQGDLPNLQNAHENGLLSQFAPTFNITQPLINQKDDKPDFRVKRGNFYPKRAFVTLPPYPIVDVICAPDVYPLTAGFLQQYHLLISLDTEYTLIEGTTRNHILSYQFAALYNDNGVWKYTEDILYTGGPEVSSRLALTDILRVVIKERFRISRRKANKLHVLIVWQFGVAEWAALKDRDSLVSHLQVVRKVPVTFQPFPVVLDYGSRHYAHPKIHIRDTRLLAPSEMQSLKEIATMTHFDKLDLSDDEKERMDRLLADAPERFADYAINDVRVALEYYLGVMADFEALFECGAQPMTLGGAAVKAYLNRLDHHSDLSHEIIFGYGPYEIRNKQGHKVMRQGQKKSRRYTETMAADAYMGGMNVAYRIGTYHDPDKLILDIDFAGAYAAALATLPILDWDAPVGSVTTTQLTELYQPGSVAVPITLVECRFEFPGDCEYPCLPIPSPYGLIYPLKGSTTCTGLEVAQALLMGAEIEMIRNEWFPTLTSDTDRERLVFAEFLQTVTQKRDQEPKGSLRNLMLKEIVNSFYGKQAQGIKERRLYNLQGQSKPLEPSPITCPHYAAITTGIVRASLIAIVTEVAKHDGCETLSATTDGCMIAVPRSLLNFDIQQDESGRLVRPTSAKEVIPTLYHAFMQHYPIQVLEQGRLNMHLPADTWLEIKHGGDTAHTYKTRGYHLTYQGITQHIARAGLKLEYDAQLDELYTCDDIPKLGFQRLASMRMIIEGEVEDLVKVPEGRTVNLDYDYKRIPLPDGSGKTRPPQTVQEVTAARDAVNRLHKQEIKATPENVAIALTGIQMRGGAQAAIRRYIRRAVMHDVGSWRPYGLKDSEIARRVGVPVSTLRQDKRREFYPQKLPPMSEVLSIIKEEAKRFGIHLTRTRLEAVVGPIDDIPAGEEMARELSRAMYDQFLALHQAGEKVWSDDIERMLNESFERLPMQEALAYLCEEGMLEVSITKVGDISLVALLPGPQLEKEGLWPE